MKRMRNDVKFPFAKYSFIQTSGSVQCKGIIRYKGLRIQFYALKHSIDLRHFNDRKVEYRIFACYFELFSDIFNNFRQFSYYRNKRIYSVCSYIGYF